MRMNNITRTLGMGGIFHGAIVIGAAEFAFGACERVGARAAWGRSGCPRGLAGQVDPCSCACMLCGSGRVRKASSTQATAYCMVRSPDSQGAASPTPRRCEAPRTTSHAPNRAQGTGVYSCPVGKNPMYLFRESLDLGETQLTLDEVRIIL